MDNKSLISGFGSGGDHVAGGKEAPAKKTGGHNPASQSPKTQDRNPFDIFRKSSDTETINECFQLSRSGSGSTAVNMQLIE